MKSEVSCGHDGKLRAEVTCLWQSQNRSEKATLPSELSSAPHAQPSMHPSVNWSPQLPAEAGVWKRDGGCEMPVKTRDTRPPGLGHALWCTFEHNQPLTILSGMFRYPVACLCLDVGHGLLGPAEAQDRPE